MTADREDEIRMDVKKGRGPLTTVRKAQSRAQPETEASPTESESEAKAPPAAPLEVDRAETEEHVEVLGAAAEVPPKRYAFATHRPAPPTERDEERQLASIQPERGEKRVSTGFVLGVGILVISLVAGIAMVRLYHRVSRAEERIERLEKARSSAPFLFPGSP